MNQEIIKLNQVAKEYAQTLALTNISFSVFKNQVHGLLGPNGAGKTTTMNILAGLISPTRGEVWVDGKSPGQAKGLIGYLPENPPLYLDMTVISFLNFVSTIYGVPEKLKKKLIDKAMEKTNIADISHRLIGNLSKGLKQRVAMSMTLVFDPPILIWDEPMVGLDPKSLNEIRKLIIDLKNDHTILFSSHNLRDVQVLCSDISIIQKGRVLVSDTIENIEQKYQTKKVIKAVVSNIEKFQVDRLKDLNYVQNIEVSKLTGGHQILFNLFDKKERRGDISQALVGAGVELLALETMETDLENIFLKMTDANKPEQARL